MVKIVGIPVPVYVFQLIAVVGRAVHLDVVLMNVL